jgi:hypothetical protein
MDSTLTPVDRDLSDYVLSDYRTFKEMDTEADIPVPDRLLPRTESRRLVEALKLSQKIGLLLWLNRAELITLGGRERLLYLQAKASFEALEAGLRFARRLTQEEKLRSDFKHQLRELNRRPQSKHFRQAEARRIGVGYRDKGMLPDPSLRARRQACEESWIRADLVPQLLLRSLTLIHPAILSEDGEWVDLSMVPGSFGTQRDIGVRTQLLPPL